MIKSEESQITEPLKLLNNYSTNGFVKFHEFTREKICSSKSKLDLNKIFVFSSFMQLERYSLSLDYENDKLTENSVESVVSKCYEIQPLSVKEIHSGVTNVYKIRAEKSNYIFRLSNPRYTNVEMSNIIFEANWTRYLRKYLLVSYPILTNKHDNFVLLNSPNGMMYGILVEQFKGTSVSFREEDSNFMRDSQVAVFAQHLAKLHEVSRDFHSEVVIPNRSLSKLNSDALKIMEDHIEKSPNDDFAQYFIEEAKTCRSDLKNSDPIGFETIIWGDSHPFNCLYNNEENRVFFHDFDLCGMGSNLYDIATYFDNLMINKFPNRINAQDTFLRSYSSINRLNSADIKGIKLAMKIRQIHAIGTFISMPMGEKFRAHAIQVYEDKKEDLIF